MPLPFVLEPHRIGPDGPFWCDAFSVHHDGTLGLIIHSTGFYPSRDRAVNAAWRWLAWRRRTTVVLHQPVDS